MQLPDWVMNKIKRQHIIVLTWVTKMKLLSLGEYLDVVQKVSLLFFFMLNRIRGAISTWEGYREGEREVLNEEARSAASELPEGQVISCCVINQVPGGEWEMEGRG